jgi:hypothetical protein
MSLKIQMSILSIAIFTSIAMGALLLTITTNESTNLAIAQGPARFGFNLTGADEVPPVNTNSTGKADISSYNVAGDSISYSINATNIKDVTAGHIHFGKPGENGPIVFTLFEYDSPQNGVLESGVITSDKLQGPLDGKKVSDLAFAGANGTLYMNIHTVENPDGEIRGTSTIPP